MVRSMLLPEFGELQLEAITTAMIERWIRSIALDERRKRSEAIPSTGWALVESVEIPA